MLATGSEFAPDQPAQGAVVFTNRRAEAQDIPPGTMVATSTGSNVGFETIQPAFLPGGVGAQVTVPIRAVEPGPAGNVRAFTINTIEGSLGVSANVINPSGTSGGTVKEVPMVKQGDKDRCARNWSSRPARRPIWPWASCCARVNSFRRRPSAPW